MSVRNKLLFFFALITILFLPVISKAVYNLSPFYAKVSQLVYSFVGDVPSNATGFIMNGVFYSNGEDGETSAGATAIDLAGDRLYVADIYGSVRIERFVLSTGTFDGAIGKSSLARGTCIIGAQPGWCTGGEFVAGDLDGEFNSVGDIKLDIPNDLMYVADSAKVSKFRLSTGAFIGSIGSSASTVGTCVTGAQSGWCTGGVSFVGDTADGTFQSAYDLAIDPTHDFLYVVDGSNNRIEKFVLSTGAFVGAIGNAVGGTCTLGAQTTWCTGGVFASSSFDGAFDEVAAIDIDPVGDYLYAADDLNRRIQRFVLSTGAFSAEIGNSTASGTCIAGKQNSWCTGGTFSSGTGTGMFRGLADVKIDTIHDRMYVADYDANRVQQFVLSTGAVIGSIGKSTVATGTCVVGSQAGWCTGGNFDYGDLDGELTNIGKMYIETVNNILYVGSGDKLNRYNAATGAFTGSMGASSVLTSNWSQNPSGAITTNRANGGFNNAYEFAIDPVNDRIYTVKWASIEKAVLSTGAYIGSIGRSSKASGTCVSGNQNSWCVGGDFISGSSDGTFSYPEGIAIDVTNDRMYIASGQSYSVQKFVLSTGAFIGAIGNSTATGTCLSGKQSNWCVGGSFSYGTADGQFTTASKVTIDVGGDRMYVLENYGGRIQKFVLSSGAFIGSIGNATSSTGTCVVGVQTSWCTGGAFTQTVIDGGLSGTFNFVIDTVGDSLLVSQYDGGIIQKFVLSNGSFVGTIGNSTASGTCLAGKQTTWCTGGSFTSGALDGMFTYPKSMAVDSTHDLLYISDDGNSNIQKFKLSTGAFIGAIGGSTVVGNCLSGRQKEWCVGGNFYAGSRNGFFKYIAGIALDIPRKRLFATDSYGLHKITW